MRKEDSTRAERLTVGHVVVWTSVFKNRRLGDI